MQIHDQSQYSGFLSIQSFNIMLCPIPYCVEKKKFAINMPYLIVNKKKYKKSFDSKKEDTNDKLLVAIIGMQRKTLCRGDFELKIKTSEEVDFSLMTNSDTQKVS